MHGVQGAKGYRVPAALTTPVSEGRMVPHMLTPGGAAMVAESPEVLSYILSFNCTPVLLVTVTGEHCAEAVPAWKKLMSATIVAAKAATRGKRKGFMVGYSWLVMNRSLMWGVAARGSVALSHPVRCREPAVLHIGGGVGWKGTVADNPSPRVWGIRR